MLMDEGRRGADGTRHARAGRVGVIEPHRPHLDLIEDPAVLRAELELVRVEYNTVRLHAGIGYVTPDDEHEGRGPAIRKARRDGLSAARAKRIDYHRQLRQPQPPEVPDVD